MLPRRAEAAPCSIARRKSTYSSQKCGGDSERALDVLTSDAHTLRRMWHRPIAVSTRGRRSNMLNRSQSAISQSQILEAQLNKGTQQPSKLEHKACRLSRSKPLLPKRNYNISSRTMSHRRNYSSLSLSPYRMAELGPEMKAVNKSPGQHRYRRGSEGVTTVLPSLHKIGDSEGKRNLSTKAAKNPIQHMSAMIDALQVDADIEMCAPTHNYPCSNRKFVPLRSYTMSDFMPSSRSKELIGKVRFYLVIQSCSACWPAFSSDKYTQFCSCTGSILKTVCFEIKYHKKCINSVV